MRLALAAALAALALGCPEGERPSSQTPRDATVPEPEDADAFVRPDALEARAPDAVCGGLTVALTRRNATVVLVIDRSGSMGDNTTDMRVKWEALREALRAVLPRFGNDVSLGLTLFPAVLDPPDAGVGQTPAQVCSVPTALAVEPAPRQLERVLQRLDLSTPSGPTPTAASLALVREWYAAHPDLTGERYVILATDGGPNCNLVADNRTCRCTGGPMLCADTNSFARINCLDEGPALAEVRALHAAGVRTFVIGLNGTQDFADVLNRMADAGGRARVGDVRYYPAASATEIESELGRVTRALADCTLRLDMPPVDPELVDIRLDGRSLYRDPRRMNGWDWGDERHLEIVFHGGVCDDVQRSTGGSRLVATFGCPAPAPP